MAGGARPDSGDGQMDQGPRQGRGLSAANVHRGRLGARRTSRRPLSGRAEGLTVPASEPLTRGVLRRQGAEAERERVIAYIEARAKKLGGDEMVALRVVAMDLGA